MAEPEEDDTFEYDPQEVLAIMAEGFTVSEVLYHLGLEHQHDEIVEDMIEQGHITEDQIE